MTTTTISPLPIPETLRSAVAVCSGGMDSSVLLAWLVHHGVKVSAISFDYGQRHGARELDAARSICASLDVEHRIVVASSWGATLSGSALTDPDVAVPEGHYADETMRATVVPNRNMTMLSMAAGVAVAVGADGIATGVHAGDHPVYPDCRPEFIESFESAVRLACEGHAAEPFHVLAPFVRIGKHDIVALADRIGFDPVVTWSCYKGGDVHCGRCGTCVERREAFDLGGVDDRTEYESVA